jgi:hypothetical protein
MLVPQKNKDENITEYLLYMWQIEDIIRACKFDIETIQANIIDRSTTDASLQIKTRKWYQELIEAMKNERIRKKGHLEELKYIVYELTYLHNSLLNVFQDNKYIEIYNKALDNIKQLQSKSDGTINNEVEICLNGLYGMFLLKIQKKSVTQETIDAVKSLSKMMGYLSQKYFEMKKGKLNFPVIRNN